MRAIIVLSLLLASCAANKPEIPPATGAWVHLNGDKYPTDQNDLTTAPKP